MAPEANVKSEELEAVGLAIQQELMNAFAFAHAWQSAHHSKVCHGYEVNSASIVVPRSNLIFRRAYGLSRPPLVKDCVKWAGQENIYKNIKKISQESGFFVIEI